MKFIIALARRYYQPETHRYVISMMDGEENSYEVQVIGMNDDRQFGQFTGVGTVSMPNAITPPFHSNSMNCLVFAD